MEEDKSIHGISRIVEGGGRHGGSNGHSGENGSNGGSRSPNTQGGSAVIPVYAAGAAAANANNRRHQGHHASSCTNLDAVQYPTLLIIITLVTWSILSYVYVC